MKKIFLSGLASLWVSVMLAQEFKPLKSPDVTAFMEANLLPINNYTGMVDINIPIYTINLDGMQIPISLSYNTNGVKIDGSASRVGLNWSLNAGGMIARETRGEQDHFRAGSYNAERGEIIFRRYGFLADLFMTPITYKNGGGGIVVPQIRPAQYRDTQPDLIHVSAPGLNTKFVHKDDGSIFELTKSLVIIKSPFEGVAPIADRAKWVSEFEYKITNPNGFLYSFQDRETNAVFPQSRSTRGYTDDLVTAPWPITKSEAEVAEHLYSNNLSLVWGDSYEELFPVVHLSSITNPRTKRAVRYYYKQNNVVDNNRRIERTYSLSFTNTNLGIREQTNYEHDFSVEKMIDKIVFPDGTIDFYYEDGRLDVPGGKRLAKIEVRNGAGKFIKGLVFEHSYYTAAGCTDPQCYRLKLDAIKFTDKDNNALPGYRFEYNSTPLPKRYSLNNDFAGFYNGNHGLALKNYLPKLYFKANQGKHTYLPFPLPAEGYVLAVGNASLTPDLSFAKAGILERMTLPTGGYSIFSYELNSFLFKNTLVEGGGLRIASQAIYTEDNSIKRRISYNYNESTSLTSGRILDVPRYVIYDPKRLVAYNLNQFRTGQLELTSNAMVGYATCKIFEADNGYTLNTYSNPGDTPDIDPPSYTVYMGEDAKALQLFNAGLAPSIKQNMEIKRGVLLSSRVYDNNENLIKRTTNSYTYKPYSEISLAQNFVLKPNPSPYQNGSTDPYMQFQSKWVSESFLLTEKLEEYKTGSTWISTNKSFVFDFRRPILKEHQLIDSKDNTVKNVYSYPFDADVSTLPNMSKLVNLNILNQVRKKYIRNGIQINDTLTSYADFGDRKIFPSSISGAQSSFPLQTVTTFQDYDKEGNLTQYTNSDGIVVTILWGYYYQLKIAEIVGATYATVLAALGATNADYLQSMSNAQLTAELNRLRTGLPNAQVHTYLHTPLVGTTTITDPNQHSNSFEYDSFNRLVSVKDNLGNITSAYSYNLIFPTSVSVTPINLSVDLKMAALDDYKGLPVLPTYRTDFTAIAKGGNGDYVYEWKKTGMPAVIGTEASLTISMGCGESYSVDCKVTDGAGLSVTKTLVSTFTHACDSPLTVSALSNSNGGNTVTVKGGSWLYSYRWEQCLFTPCTTSTTTTSNTSPFPPIFHGSRSPLQYTVGVTVTDTQTGASIYRSVVVTVPPTDGEIPSCFVAGTKIRMQDGTEKSIEEVKIGDRIVTYNTKTKLLESGNVESIVTPIHSELIELEFDNGVTNTNTLDHPYFVVGKGWASFKPTLTKKNYGLNVESLEIGDITLYLHPSSKHVEEVKLRRLQIIKNEVTTYNLSRVSDNRNFFANGILVHNKSSN
jgi:YD repeat-containing protein